jgi:hypothetical protein
VTISAGKTRRIVNALRSTGWDAKRYLTKGRGSFLVNLLGGIVKRFSLLAVAAVAALAITAALGAASASATVLCKTANASCPTADIIGAGTEISATLQEKAVFKLNGAVFSTCNKGSIKVQLTDAGGDARNVQAKDTSYSLSECTYITSFTNTGRWEISSSGSNNGSVVDLESIIQMTVSGAACKYRFPSSSELKGGTTAKLVVNGAATRASGSDPACPETLTMSATYSVSSPAPLYVEEHGPLVVLCKVSGANCAEGNRYGVGTKLSASLKPGTSVVLTETGEEGSNLDVCKSSSLEGEVTNAGITTETVKADITGASFGSCTWATTVESLPWHSEIKRSAVTGNGTQTINGIRLKVAIPLFGSCYYGGSATFALTGGAGAELSANKVTVEKLTGSSMGCPPKALLSATYLVSSPNPLYVTAP